MFRLCTILFILQSVVGLDPGCYKKLWQDSVAKARTWQRPTNSSEFEGCRKKCVEAGTFDFVIIGAGTGGSVLARRLSENPEWTVLVLEAGENENSFNKIPAAEPYALASSSNWGYLTTPQEHACLSRNDNQCAYHAGKSVGGNSAIDDMEFTRGNRVDFDLWVEMGLKGWGYNDVLKYFKKQENVTNIVTDCEYRGFKGPQDVTYAEPPTSLFENIESANHEMGYENGDYNGKSQFVTSRTQVTLRNGLRESSGCAFLMSVYDERDNLHLLTKALATKITFGKGRRANSVNYFHKGACHNVRARKEIIVSAGAINSPKLLMLSGIGSQETLESLNISVVANISAVGQNYRESIEYPVYVRQNASTPKFDLDEELRDLVWGVGDFTQTKIQALSFINLFPWKNVERPDFALKFEPASHLDDESVTSVTENLSPMGINAIKNTHSLNDMVMWIELFHTQSVGSVTINSSDPLAYPLINPNLLSNPDDVEDLVIAILYALQYLDTQSFKSINAYLNDELELPACRHLKGAFRLICIIKHFAAPSSHATGTCRMGKNSTDSVVNEKLYVHGIRKLRVVDGSVIPTTVSGKTNSVTAMIAEKISDEIKRLFA